LDSYVHFFDLAFIVKEISVLVSESTMSPIKWTAVQSYADALSELQNGTEAIRVRTEYKGNEQSFLALTKALARNQTCTYLSLYYDQIGPEGAIEIADALKVNTTLTSLNLRWNNIEPEGAKQVADALKTNSSLISLILYGNEIGAEGAKEIADALKVNISLASLDLAVNNIGINGAEEIAGALKQNKTLTTLDLAGNGADKDTLNQIEVKLKQNKENPTPKVTNKIDLIKTALKTGVQVPYGRSKLMVIGQGRAGKTSTVRTLLGESFEYQKSTKGINAVDRLTTRKWKRMDRDFRQDLQEAGAKAVAKLQKERIQPRKRIHSCQHVELGTPSETRHSISRTIQSRSYPQSNNEEIVQPIRIDIDEEEVAKKFDSNLVLSKDGQTSSEVTFTIWDFGGQEIFYTLHHVFLTKYGVYLLVFNMNELLKKTDEGVRYLRFWLDSVKLHAPSAPIILIGTFLDVVNGENKLEQVEEILCERVDIDANRQVCNDHSDLSFYPLDNTGSNGQDGVATIRKQIEEIVIGEYEFDVEYITKPVKLAWTYFIDLLVEKKEPTIKRSEVLKIASTHSITEQEMEKVLTFFHELGIIVYFGSDEQLRSHVTFQPQWLIDAFACVIYDPQVHKSKVKKLKGKLKDDRIAYKQTGILTTALLQELLKEYNTDDFVYLVRLLERMLLISPWIFDEDKDDMPRFLVPSLLKYKTKSKEHEFNYDGPCFYFDFGELMPTGIFQRIICQFVEQSCQYEGSARPTIEYSFAALSFGYTEFRMDLVNGPEENKIRITFEKDYSKEKPFVVSFAVKVLEKLRESIAGSRLVCEVLLTSIKNSNISCSYDKLVKLRGDKESFARTPSQRRKGRIEDYDHWFDGNNEGEENERYDVFLAHDWGAAGDNFPTHEKVKRINRLLKEQCITTWFDDSNMGAITDVGVAEGIRQSRAVIIFITKRYSNRLENQKNNCTKEFLYAVGHKEIENGEIIPVVLDKEMQDHNNWGDRLELNVPRVNMYISMTSSEEVEGQLDELVSRIREVQH